MSLSGIIHHSHLFTRLKIYHHIYFNNNHVCNYYSAPNFLNRNLLLDKIQRLWSPRPREGKELLVSLM